MKIKTYKLLAICHFGLEAVLKREIYDLGYEIDEVSDGRVIFIGDAEAIVRANICLRTAERILILLQRFKAKTFEEYFDKMEEIPWEEFIPLDGRFYVKKATSVKSRLFSARDLQSLGKKAMVKRLSKIYKKDIFKETGNDYPVRVNILKDWVTVSLDTSGTPLHKRGYRTLTAEAPIRETMASSLIMLTPWKKDRILLDPFCGSGTFLIEAALMAANIPPGIDREFTFEKWDNIVKKSLVKDIRHELRKEIDLDIKTDLKGYDKDPEMIRISRENAINAGVSELVHFEERDVSLTSHKKPYGFLITNPPYGERLLSKEELPDIYKALGDLYKRLSNWSMYVITSYEDAERQIGRSADKNRKLYNGMIKAYFYEFRGEKPKKFKKG